MHFVCCCSLSDCHTCKEIHVHYKVADDSPVLNIRPFCLLLAFRTMAVVVSDKLGNPIYNRSAHCTKVSDIGPWAYSLFNYV